MHRNIVTYLTLFLFSFTTMCGPVLAYDGKTPYKDSINLKDESALGDIATPKAGNYALGFYNGDLYKKDSAGAATALPTTTTVQGVLNYVIDYDGSTGTSITNSGMTYSQETASPLVGAASHRLTWSTGTATSTFDLNTIDEAYLGNYVQVSTELKASTTGFSIGIWDSVGTAWVKDHNGNENVDIPSGAVYTYSTQFIPLTGKASDYKIRVQALASSGYLLADELFVGPDTVAVSAGGAGPDLEYAPTVTPETSGSIDSYNANEGYWRTSGGKLQGHVFISMATMSSPVGNPTISLPSGYTIPDGFSTATVVGNGGYYDGSAAQFTPIMINAGTDKTKLYVSPNNASISLPIPMANGDQVRFDFSVPVNELSGNVQNLQAGEPNSEMIADTGFSTTHGGTSSGETRIRNFTNFTADSEAVTHNARTTTTADSFTIKISGGYYIEYSDRLGGGASDLGISKNAKGSIDPNGSGSDQTSTTIGSVTFPERLAFTQQDNGFINSVSGSVILKAGDVIRAHTSGAPNLTDSRCVFTIRHIANSVGVVGVQGASSVEDGLLSRYQTTSVVLTNDGTSNINGTLLLTRIGNVVTVASDGLLTHGSSATPSSSTSAIPSDYIPSNASSNTYYHDTTAARTLTIYNDGSFTLLYRDDTVAPADTGSGAGVTITYIMQ